MDYMKIMEMEPIDLISWLNKNFLVQMPQHITSVSDMNQASELLMRLSGN